MTVVRRGARLLMMAGMLLAANVGRANADMCDLTTSGSSCGSAFGPSYGGLQAIFQQLDVATNPQPLGNIFLNSQPNGTTTQQAYNTDGRPIQPGFDTVDGTTHSIKLSDIFPVVNVDGSDYRQFFLDIQATSGNSQVSLDQLQVFLSSSSTETGYANGKLNGISPIYDLDNGVDNWIKLDAVLNPTGTTGDLIAFIPDSLFTGTDPYVYIYAQLGQNVSADGIFSEWWVDAPKPVPEPASLVLFGSGLVVIAGRLRSKARRKSSKAASAQTKVAAAEEFPRQVS